MIQNLRIIFISICFCVILLYCVVLLKYFDNLLFVVFIKRFNIDDAVTTMANYNINTNNNENVMKKLSSEKQILNEFTQTSSTRLKVTYASALSIESGPLSKSSVLKQSSAEEYHNRKVIDYTQTSTTTLLQHLSSIASSSKKEQFINRTTIDSIDLETKFLDLMTSRLKRIKDKCRRKKDVLNTAGIFWIPDKHIAYCPVPKSASTTWLTYMIDSLDNPKKEKDEAKSKYGNERIQILRYLGVVEPTSTRWVEYVNNLPSKNSLIAFTIVRHPFYRLVSAFRSKLEVRNAINPIFYETYGKQIVTKYRAKAISVLGKEYFSKINNFGTPIKPSSSKRDYNLPSFWEFVQAIIDGSIKMDAHWTPIHQFCSICHPITLKAFKYILKLESIETERPILLKYLKWNKKLDASKALNAKKPSDLSEEELTQIYFSVLSKKQVTHLFEIYKLDFSLFDYTFQFKGLNFP